MNLSTRLTGAMISLVLLTALAVGYLSYRNLEAIVIPAEATRLDARARIQAAVLDSYVRWARADILAGTSLASLEGFLRARLAGGIDPLDGTKETIWRERYTQNFVAQLKAKPEYTQFRLIGVADGGREIIRVDRFGPSGKIRIVPDGELQAKGDRAYFKDTIRLRPGEVYISQIELNQERGTTQLPHLPVIRVGTPIFGPDGKPFGIIIINIDMRPALAELRRSAREHGFVYLVNEVGDYLVHPDTAHEFGRQLGRPYRIQNEFPALDPEAKDSANPASEVRNGAGKDFVMGSLRTRLAGGPQITIVDSLPLDVVLASAATVEQSSLIGAIIAALCAGLLAALTARSLTQPLRSLTHSLEHFSGEEAIDVPEKAAGEIGVLARALKRMADAVREKTATIRQYAEREKLYIAAAESASDAIFTVDLAGAITTWNEAAERLFGYSAEEAIGKHVSFLATSEQRKEQETNFARIKRGERIENFETTRMRKDGATLHLSYNYSPVLSTSGEIVGASAIARDITARKQAEEMFRMAVEASPGAMIMADQSGKIVLVNAETERMFGYERGELIGRPVEILVPKPLRDMHVQHRNTYSVQPSRRIMGAGRDLFGVRKDGSEVAIEIGLNPIKTMNGLVVLAAIVDITERKHHETAMAERTAELQRSNAELEQFAYVASHDLQEPLRMVASYAELLADRYQGKLDERADKYIGYAVDGAKRMQRLVNDLLTYSRVGTQGLPLQSTEMSTVVGHTLRSLKPKIDAVGAEIVVDVLPTVDADEVQLGQVFQNLVANALKFNSSGKTPRVHIGAKPSPQGWTFFVEDNGIGIDGQYSERVFQMFQRLHDRETYEGSGIGLTIAKKIVERHGGRIWFESEPGKGATFFFTLPATKEKAA